MAGADEGDEGDEETSGPPRKDSLELLPGAEFLPEAEREVLRAAPVEVRQDKMNMRRFLGFYDPNAADDDDDDDSRRSSVSTVDPDQVLETVHRQRAEAAVQEGLDFPEFDVISMTEDPEQ